MPALVQALEARRLLALVTWDGGGDNTTWTEAANWSGDVLPSANDDVVIGMAGPSITIPDGTALNSLTISNRAVQSPLWV